MDAAPSVDPVPAAQPAQPPASTIGRELLGGLIGIGVALGCVLPPLLHIVTGPLGAGIGGFIGGKFARPGARGHVIIAATIGSGLAALGGGIAALVLNFGGSSTPDWFPSKDTIGMILAGVWLYGTALGAAGVAVSRAWADKDAS